jgi:transglutaminase/protease-like cytokinesis protein 3
MALALRKRYGTSYLFPPPEVMVVSHYPDDAAWQLLSQPLSRGDFFRQPMLRPAFFAQGLKLLSPTRSQTDVQGNAVIQLENPRQRWLMASYGAKGSQQTAPCAEQTSQGTQLACPCRVLALMRCNSSRVTSSMDNTSMSGNWNSTKARTQRQQKLYLRVGLRAVHRRRNCHWQSRSHL